MARSPRETVNTAHFRFNAIVSILAPSFFPIVLLHASVFFIVGSMCPLEIITCPILQSTSQDDCLGHVNATQEHIMLDSLNLRGKMFLPHRIDYKFSSRHATNDKPSLIHGWSIKSCHLIYLFDSCFNVYSFLWLHQVFAWHVGPPSPLWHLRSLVSPVNS